MGGEKGGTERGVLFCLFLKIISDIKKSVLAFVYVGGLEREGLLAAWNCM